MGLVFDARHAGIENAASATATMHANATNKIENSGAGRFGISDDRTRPSASPPASPTTCTRHRQADALFEDQPQHD